MTFKNAPQNKKAPAEVTPPPTYKPVLGVSLKGELVDVPLAKVIDPLGLSDRAPREGDEERIRQMAKSMADLGQLQPVMLEALADGRFCRVFGRRRIAAARLSKMETIRAVVVPPLSEDVRRTVVAVENVQRQDLTPPEETLAVAELIELKAFEAAVQLGKPLEPVTGRAGVLVTPEVARSIREKSTDERLKVCRRELLQDHRVRSIAYELVAAMLAKPVTWVRDRAYIGRLSDKAQGLVREGKLPLAHAREIAKVADAVARDQLAADYAAGGRASSSETEAGLLLDLQEEVRRRVFALHTVPWKLDVPFADQRACVGCPHNSQAHPGLFEHGGFVSTEMHAGLGRFAATAEKTNAAGICTLTSCYEAKNREARRMLAGAAKAIVENKGRPESRFMDAAERVLESKAIELRVKERRDAIKNRTHSSSSKPIVKGPEVLKREAIEQANREWQIAVREWTKSLEPKLAATLAKKPGAWVMFHLLTESPLYKATQGGNDKARAKAMNDPRLARAINLAAGGASLASIIELEKICGRNLDLINPWYDGQSGWAERVAKNWGIDHGTPPVVEDFLPAEYGGKKKSAEKPRPVAGKPAKPGTKSKAVSRVTRAGGEDGSGE
jgi:ParB family chromosome partitioning protein